MSATPRFEGFDHIDCRVASLAAVEAFYAALMPELGLPVRRYSHVDQAGNWHEPSEARPYNAVEFFETPQAGRAAFFIGIIERPDHVAGATRIAFRVSAARMREIESRLAAMGALNVERDDDIEAYPAIFFQDPAGTQLELVARRHGDAG